MRTTLGALVVWASLAGCSCSGDSVHQPDAGLFDGGGDGTDDASGIDAPPTDAGLIDMGHHDVGRPDATGDGGPCDPTFPFCDNDFDCVSWAQNIAPPGTYAVSFCGGGRRCTYGDMDCVTTAFGTTMCSCAPGIGCGAGQVCVSDTPDGPRYCAVACEGH